MPCRYLLGNEPLLKSAVEPFQDCGYVRDGDGGKYVFMNNYIINSVLSYIEEREQDLVLGMQYNDWVIIDDKARREIEEHIVEYIRRFITACGKDGKYGKDYFEKLRDEVSNGDVVERSLCYLYVFGIYGDCISRYILIKPPEGGEVPDYDVYSVVNKGDVHSAEQAFNKCVEVLSRWRRGQKSYQVRSRFIEIVRDLYLLKQRFPDKSVFDSYLLVDRVFAYVYPRNLPLGIYTIDDDCKEFEEIAHRFFREYHNYLIGDYGDSDDDFSIFWRVFCNFMKKALGDRRLYKFQVRGVKAGLSKLAEILRGHSQGGAHNQGLENIDYLVITAPTGSGKTEIMALIVVIAALARKVIQLMHNIDDRRNTPIAILVYPRRSLANDQISRLIYYLYVLNSELRSNEELKKLLGDRLNNVKLSLTVNYTDVRHKDEYIDAANRAIRKEREKGRIALGLRYGISAFLTEDRRYIELRFLTCPDKLVRGSGSIYPRFRLRVEEEGGEVRKVMDVDDSVVLCGDEELDFVSLTKNRVRERLGDVHITIFETLRYNLILNNLKGIFGICRRVGNRGVFDYPLVIVLDEIHTYTDVPGVRYAFMLRRVLNRIRYDGGGCGNKPPGALIIGMSATIPRAEEFLSDLFLSEDIRRNIKKYLISVEEGETIPLGAEYFIITVPTRRAPVDALTVSIQTVMDTFYNLPSIPVGNGSYVKKAIVFMEEFNVLRRMKRELYNEESGAIYRKDRRRNNVVFGLQDLRNPRSQYFRDTTLEDYGDDEGIIRDVARGMISKVVDTGSWLDGELWWGYALDTMINYYSGKNNGNMGGGIDHVTTRFNNVIEYSSSIREDVRGANIVVSTSSLEVGVDYSDVVLIYQHGAPRSISALIQRAGRGGRRLFDYPLMRVVVGIQLSPDLPHQSWLFEIFTRVKNLRSALEYDKLFLPVNSKELRKQTFAELVLEYYKLTGGIISRETNWECKLIGWLRENGNEVINYSWWAFGNENPGESKEKLKEFINDLMNYLDRNCGQGVNGTETR